MCKLGLTVSAEVLVSEATRYLEVTVKARYHQKLLVELRRLGKSIEFALVNSGGDKIVSCSLGGRLAEVGSFDIDKSVLCIIVSRELADTRARDDISLHIGTAKVEISVAQTKLCVYLAVLGDLKGRCLSRGDDLELVDCDLDLACGERVC